MKGLIILGLAAGGAYLLLNQSARNRLKGLAERSPAGRELIRRERYESSGSDATPAGPTPYVSGQSNAISAFDVAPSVNAYGQGERALDVVPDMERGERAS